MLRAVLRSVLAVVRLRPIVPATVQRNVLLLPAERIVKLLLCILLLATILVPRTCSLALFFGFLVGQDGEAVILLIGPYSAAILSCGRFLLLCYHSRLFLLPMLHLRHFLLHICRAEA